MRTTTLVLLLFPLLSLPSSGEGLLRRCSPGGWQIPPQYFHEPKDALAFEEPSFSQFSPNFRENVEGLDCLGRELVSRELVPGELKPFPEFGLVSILQWPGALNKSSLNLQKNDLCLERDESNETFSVSYCVPRCDLQSPCLRKCCDPGRLVEMSIFACAKSTRNWKPMADPEPGVVLAEEVVEVATEEIGLVPLVPPLGQLRASHSGEPSCPTGSYELDFRHMASEIRRLAILPNGSLELVLESSGERFVVPWEEYCVDGIATKKKLQGRASYFENRVVIICNPPEGNETDSFSQFDSPNFVDVLHKYRESLYPVLTGTSSLFLLVTCVIYTLLWKELNLPGWLQFSYATSLLIAFTLLTIVQLWTNQIFHYSQALCKLVGYTLHASFLSCFFWLTSMNIDLWLSFRNTKIISSFGRKRGKKRYCLFTLFSIIIPLLDTGIAVIIDYKIQAGEMENGIPSRTGIGELGCALNIRDRVVHLFYFYGVVGTLLAVNFLFFICTVFCLRERQRETKFAHRQCTANDSADLLRFRLFTRLFFIMGILWIFELLSWLSVFLEASPGLQSVFVVTDSLNGLQGVAVFFMFVWKPQTWKQLRKKWSKLLSLDSQQSLMGPTTVKSSVKSTSTKSSQSGSSKSANVSSPMAEQTECFG